MVGFSALAFFGPDFVAFCAIWVAGSLLCILLALGSRISIPDLFVFFESARAREEVMRWLALGGTQTPDGVRLVVRGRQATVESKGTVFVLRVSGSPSEVELDAIRRALRTRGVKMVSVERGSVVMTARSLATGLGATNEGERLLRIMERVVELTPLVEEVLLVRPLALDRPRCPYCHDEVALDSTHAVCRKCGSAHHTDCYDDHGRCAIFACGGAAQRAPSRASLSAATFTGSSSPDARIAT